MTSRQRVVVHGPNIPFPDGTTFHVHAEGCADLNRAPYRGAAPDQGGWAVEVGSVREVVEAVYGDMIAESGDPWDGWYLVDIAVKPCVTVPREVASDAALGGCPPGHYVGCPHDID